MFNIDQFIADCRAALAGDKSHKSVREIVARAVSDPAAILKGLGEPKRSEVQKLYHSSDLTILNVIWAPRMTIMPHNHLMAPGARRPWRQAGSRGRQGHVCERC